VFASGVPLAATTASATWTPPGLGTYYVCAHVDDGANTSLDAVSARVVARNQCTWTGATSVDDADPANWSSCGGTTPGGNDFVLVPQTAPRQPTLDGYATILGVGPGAGGGTLTVTVNHTLTLHAVKSDVTLGASAGAFWGPVEISNDATLTVAAGAYVVDALAVGNDNSAGNLVASGAGAPPGSAPYLQGRIDLTGPTATRPSSLELDQVVVDAHTYLSYGFFTLHKNATVRRFDGVRFVARGYDYAAIFVRSCSGVTFQATTWDGVDFDRYVPSGGSSFVYDASCTTPLTMTNPKGSGWGPDFTTDPNHLIAWPAVTTQYCAWTGAADAAWTNAANWAQCGARSGVPDQHDYVALPPDVSVPHTLVLGADATVRGIATNNAIGGGTLTIAAGARLYFSVPSAEITTDVTIQGDPATCTTCGVYWDTNLTVKGAELTMRPGVYFVPSSYWPSLSIGDGTTGGRLTTVGGADATQYPVIYGNPHGTLALAGGSGDPSVVRIDGLRNESLTNTANIAVWGNVVFDQLDRFETAHTWDGASDVAFASCVGLVFNDRAWTGWRFNGAPGASAVNVSTSCDLGVTIDVTAGGPMAGAAYANDPFANFVWH
jgi:hypothetical protein